MWTPTLVLIALTTLAGCVTLGGGLYEVLVVDPAWPKRPGIIQPRNGGVFRTRFWLPAHTIFEVLLIVALVAAWHDVDARAALLVALASHVVMRVWSLAYFIPKALAFEKADPATVDEASAVRWTRRSLLRLPFDVVTSAAMLAALVGYS
ncbi:hypothetical protein A5724_29865 [Mycobacterium sp. ACS1612]|uniref:hypothetical protein n=1 Tax=Mycobacterium sp. ACS1612 TaxID=1834117 RepID=UPI0007FCE10C|nr:hypothetical protein [Mycobacterium sp. ACS1612]OBF27807.1 hypothetical protein A5724_29865 [Mycobacterium sp. ACS1612]